MRETDFDFWRLWGWDGAGGSVLCFPIELQSFDLRTWSLFRHGYFLLGGVTKLLMLLSVWSSGSLSAPFSKPWLPCNLGCMLQALGKQWKLPVLLCPTTRNLGSSGWNVAWTLGGFKAPAGASQVQPRLRFGSIEQDAVGDFEGAGGEALYTWVP